VIAVICEDYNELTVRVYDMWCSWNYSSNCLVYVIAYVNLYC